MYQEVSKRLVYKWSYNPTNPTYRWFLGGPKVAASQRFPPPFLVFFSYMSLVIDDQEMLEAGHLIQWRSGHPNKVQRLVRENGRGRKPEPQLRDT